MLRETKTALASTGLKVHDIELARVFDGVKPSDNAAGGGASSSSDSNAGTDAGIQTDTTVQSKG